MTQAAPPELLELQRIIDAGAGYLDTRIVGEVPWPGGALPIYAIALGATGTEVPAVGFFGGVHGLERIGTEVVLAYLDSLVTRLQWDEVLHRQLQTVRLVFMPLVNPGGMALGTRANPAGVDLMRNAPITSKESVPFLVGGQRISAALPWFRGWPQDGMQPENLAVCAVVEKELLCRNFSIALDCHSGFGITDRIWFPYAHTAHPLPHLAEIHALKDIFERTHVHHTYAFEPQSRHYLAHGDLWDYLYLRAGAQHPGHTFLPLTLEMGSWAWVRKNPRQLFSRHGIFNPLVQHRQQRVLRRHMPLLDFITRAVSGYARWLPSGAARLGQRDAALALWYASALP